MDLTPEQLAELRRLHEAATAGADCNFCNGRREVWSDLHDDMLPCLACRAACQRDATAKSALRDALHNAAPQLLALARAHLAMTQRLADAERELAAATKGRDLQKGRADSAGKLLDDLEAAYESARPYPANYRPCAWEHVCDLVGELPGLLSATKRADEAERSLCNVRDAGRKGGKARAEKLTGKRRREIARQAANARWSRK